ncbi:MAG: deoxyribose-phosphate aldolase [Acidimicrobiales bacterium]
MDLGDETFPRDELPGTAYVASMIDHSLLQPQLTAEDVTVGFAIARACKVASACVRPSDVERAVAELAGSGVMVSTVIGFPHGSCTTRTKVGEVAEALSLGADEFDMVLHIGALRGHDAPYVGRDIRAVVDAASGRTVKVILENAYLTTEEKVLGCHLAEEAGARFVKTSTGYAPSGATLEDIVLMRANVSPHVGVKAAGGVRTLDTLLAMARAGATRFGASATVAILEELRQRRADVGAAADTER